MAQFRSLFENYKHYFVANCLGHFSAAPLLRILTRLYFINHHFNLIVGNVNEVAVLSKKDVCPLAPRKNNRHFQEKSNIAGDLEKMTIDEDFGIFAINVQNISYHI